MKTKRILKTACASVAGIMAALFLFLEARAEDWDSYLTLDYEKYGNRKMTQGKTAVIITRAMGLESQLAKDQNEEYCITALDSKRITPLDGWVRDELITNGVLAVILIRALNWEDELVPPGTIVKKNRAYIQRMWDMQYRLDLSREPIEKLLTDRRFFPEGEILCPYNFKYQDEEGDNLVDPIEIKPETMEKDLTVKYIYTLMERGLAFEGPSDKILSFKDVMAILRSPMFRSTGEGFVFLHEYNKGKVSEEAEEAAAPLSPEGP